MNGMQLFDMHSHILPGIDDGAKTIEDSLELLSCLKKQGVTNVCLTPHFYTNEISLEDFIAERAEKFEKFKPHIPNGMNIVLGTEVYVTKYLFNNENIKGINYGKSNYILTEFPYNATFSDNSYEMLDRLMSEQGLIPVIPHVERYRFLVDNPDVIEDLKRLGVVIQTNISNYTKKAPMMKRRRMLKLVGAGLIDIIGTDAHSFNHNTPELYSDAIECIAKKCGRQAVDRLMKNSEKIFNAAIG